KNSDQAKLFAESGKNRICVRCWKPLAPGKFAFMPSASCQASKCNRSLRCLLLIGMRIQSPVLIFFNYFCRIRSKPVMVEEAHSHHADKNKSAYRHETHRLNHFFF